MAQEKTLTWAEQKQREALKLRTILIDFAMMRKTTTYTVLAQLMDYPASGNALGAVLSPILYEVLYWCKRHNLPPLTVLVVRKSGQDEGLPGQGFWDAIYGKDPIEGKQLSREHREYHTKRFTEAVYDFWSLAPSTDENTVTVGDWQIRPGLGRDLTYVNKTLNQKVCLAATGVTVYGMVWSDDPENPDAMRRLS